MRQLSHCIWGESKVGAPTTWGADWDYYGTADHIITTLCPTLCYILKVSIIIPLLPLVDEGETVAAPCTIAAHWAFQYCVEKY